MLLINSTPIQNKKLKKIKIFTYEKKTTKQKQTNKQKQVRCKHRNKS